MRKYGISGTCRASFYVYTTEADIDHLITGIGKVREVFGIDAGANGTDRAPAHP
jgi:hypothetical protein